MLIHEAVNRAMETNNYITREALKKYVRLWIKPSNSAFGCIVGGNGKTAATCWSPTAEDLTATDWLVVTQEDYYEVLRE